jgi:cysteine synthase A
MRAEVDRIVERDGAYWTDQFHNRDALVGYAELGWEIRHAGAIDVFCAAVGTGGMLVGAGAPLRDAGARVVALEPDTSPMLTAGRSGAHRVEGTATGIVPPLLADGYDEARSVSESAARAFAVRLAREAGVFAGTSSALNILGAIEIAAEIGPGRTVATVAVDSGLKYLAGDLFTR